MSGQYKNFFVTGHKGAVGKEIEKYFSEKGLKFQVLYKGVRPEGDSVILHLASKTSGCSDIIRSNILYLQEAIELAKEIKASLFVFFSSVRVYGIQNCENLDEHTPCMLEHLDCYSASKILGEKILMESGLNVLCLRLPAILTEDLHKTFLARTLSRLFNNEEVVITNYDKIYNNFIDVPSIIDFCMSYDLKNDFHIFNLATQKSCKLKEIVIFLKQKSRSLSQITYSNASQPFFNINTDKAQSYGFIPPEPKEILADWVNGFKQ